MGVKELNYGERKDAFSNSGSYKIEPLTEGLIIYPRVAIKSDKEAIVNDGIDTAIITANVAEDMAIVFTVFDTAYSVDTVDGVGDLEVTITAIGEIIVSVDAEKFGSSTVIIEGVETIA